jgi:Na+-transporting NADH:ubiquinone oxidoreductase subunit NqrB
MSSGAPAVTTTAVKKGSFFFQIKPFLAPFLITVILVVGDINYAILQSYWLTGLAIACSIGLEIILSYVATGRFPHLASAYIGGISVGILVQTPEWWPFAVCSLLSISSKYALRVGGRHLWNPSNFGVSMLLLLAPEAMAPLSDQWGNNVWPPRIILSFGAVILFTLGRLHITFTYAVAYIALTFLRTALTGKDWHVELALMTAPAYLLFMIFMITDPKTTTRTWQRQCVVAVLVAIVETMLRLARETHAPYYALFITAPITNLLEIWWESRVQCAAPSSVTVTPPIPEGVSVTETLSK